MKPTVTETLYYPAVVVDEASSLADFRGRFRSKAAFNAFADVLKAHGAATISFAGATPQGGEFGVVVALPDGRFAACLAFDEWMFHSEQEARALAAELTSEGGECEGLTVLMMTFEPVRKGRA